MANDVHNGFIENTQVNGAAVAVATGDSLYVATTGQIYATGTAGTAIGGASQVTVTIAGQVFGDTGISTVNSGNYGGSTVTVVAGGIVHGNNYGVQMYGSDNSVTVAGQVSGDYGITMNHFNGVGGSTVTVVAGGSSVGRSPPSGCSAPTAP